MYPSITHFSGSTDADALFAAAFCASLSFLNSESFRFPFSLILAETADMPLPEDPGRESAGVGPLLEFGRESVSGRDADRGGEDELRRRVWLLRRGLRER
jgi:hypothetical protein